MNSKRTLLLCLATGTCLPLLSVAGPAGISIHGSASATLSSSTEYDFLGKTRNNVDLNTIDVILNGTRRVGNDLRIGAQLYAYKVGDMGDVMLDWGDLDYSWREWLGVRVGRNKTPFGLYNDSQDLDAVRTFASMPLTFYSKATRPVTAYTDGIALYGVRPLGKAGSLDYQVYAGAKQDVRKDTPLIRGSNNISISDGWKFQGVTTGASFFWNTPVEGLKFGWSIMISPKNQLLGRLGNSADLRPEYLYFPATVDGLFGAGTWNGSGRWAGTRADITEIRSVYRVISAEYAFSRWTLAAEYKLQDYTRGTSTIPALAQLGLPTATPFSAGFEQYYGMVTCQATDKIGVGVYYSYENRGRNTPGSSGDANQYTKDWAAAFSYAVTTSWILKLEGHLLNGRSLVWQGGDDNRSYGTHDRWTYIVAKTTYSF